ncbi:hypothetical protein LZZ90_08390 [Flavobacterium sp. SM15]|uniref:hypothetical protein n=1 Tax=Flavobacterium sp. SM15 TaxID=2908005 RepID=UPI001EDADF9C|nr:hypothetical protein [Flavobacterium sp. SM15]MCG2611525.1 hypothetical protein [Flavobacterium sp. SM15]
MRYSISVDASRGGNPDQEKTALIMVVSATEDERYQCIVVNGTQTLGNPILRNNYDDAKQSGIDYIQDNHGDATIVSVEDIEVKKAIDDSEETQSETEEK